MKKIIKLEPNDHVVIESDKIIITKENTATENSDVVKNINEDIFRAFKDFIDSVLLEGSVNSIVVKVSLESKDDWLHCLRLI